MIDSLTIWIKGIIFVVLFAAFLELLLPNNSMQRFVRVILGLFIMLAILNPVIDVIVQGLANDQTAVITSRSTSGVVDNGILNAANVTAEKREQLTKDIYKRELARQIRATVMAIDGIADAKVTVDLGENNQKGSNLAAIRSIVIYVEPGLQADDRKIAKIIVSPTSPEPAKDNAKLPSAVVDKVKRTVAELYQLKSDQVEVRKLN